ncbi:hypothetical protein DKX38_007341 [Salix brachista]|uniref:DNA polymerase n=1 Tax=Salix brachista TaxID=2182728 RepID=A0A5N5MN04_9ROSI|nr:hypothetical protein DKX38_007341 [Salix brachista]
MNRNGTTRKRPPSTPQPPRSSPAVKHQAISPTDEEFLDEDVFLDETLIAEDEENLNKERQVLTSRLSKWARPKLSDGYVSQSQSIIFQQLEIDYVIGETHKELLPDRSGPAAILRIFGVTGEGHSVCCLVHGFEPYFYVSCPPGMNPDDISHFHRILEGMMREVNRNTKVPKCVRRIELVHKRSIMYYQQQQSHPFLKIVVALPTMVSGCRGILDKGIQIDGLGMRSFLTYESNVLFALRFMIDCNVVGGNWIEVPAGKYRKTSKSLSNCQLEFDCLYSELISHAAEGEFSKMAPFRILSFDIECAGRKGHFPEPTHDPVIQVANLVTLQGEDQPFVRNIMTLNSCSPIVGVDVMSFETEREVLIAWKEFIREVDPDIIIGYNICKFDLPYLIERAATLGIAEFPVLGRIRNSRVRIKDATFSSRQYGTRESKEVTVEGRVQFDLLQVMQRDYKLSSYSLNSVSAHFLSEQKEDVHHSIISDLQNGNAETRRRLAVYCLKDAYLPQRLLDKLMLIYNYVEMARVTGVPLSFLLSRGQSIKVLSQLLRKAKEKNLVIPNVKRAGSEEGKYEGATVLEPKAGFYENPIATLDFASLYPSIMMAYNLCYCTLVTPEDVRKLNLPPECVNKTPSGETFVKSNLQKGILPEILEELLTARKRAKADLKKAKDPFEKAVLDGRQLALKISANSVYGFTGATVAQLPCLEISSSVTSYGRQMIEHTKKLVEDKFTMLGGYEHNAEVERCLSDLSAPLNWSMPAFYQFFCRISNTMVSLKTNVVMGTDAINIRAVDQTLIATDPSSNELNSYWDSYEVIYGDTDSVMVQFGVSTVEAAMKLGREAAEYISGTFIKPINLEFEKVYYPYLLISKKRYAGLLWTNPDRFDKMDTKGIETVRRDNCLLVKNLVTECLHKILIDRDVPSAIQFVKNTISDLLMNRMDLSLLVITKGLTKTGDDYEVKAAHVTLAERMRKRDAATAPNVGDRVPYVIVKGAKGAKAFEKSEDPIYVLENNIPIDPQYYLENQISKPLLRIFEPILKNASKELLQGSHTRSISISTPSTGGIMKFAKKQLTCIGCKTLLRAFLFLQENMPSEFKSHCESIRTKLFAQTAKGEKQSCTANQFLKASISFEFFLNLLSELEQIFGRLWTQCQECQGSLHQDVLCTSRDCPIFYRRKKAQKDMAEAKRQLDRWSF